MTGASELKGDTLLERIEGRRGIYLMCQAFGLKIETEEVVVVVYFFDFEDMLPHQK